MRTALAVTGISAVLFSLVLSAALPQEQLESQARKGDVNSQYLLANEYFFGRSRPVNLILALYWFRRAADGGHPEAQYNLARCFERGWGCRKSPAMAVKYYKMAMAQQLLPAKMRYAELLYRGVAAETGEYGNLPPLKADRFAALELMRQCAAKSLAGKLQLVKFLFMDAPLHGKELRSLLAEYCSKADAHPEMMVLYSSCLRAGIGGSVDQENGIAMLQMAMKKGNSEAMAQLAELYALGTGVPYDPDKSIKMTVQAAGQGNHRALVNLGKSHLSGIGVKYDPVQAVKYFKQAAEGGYPPALRCLGECYASGFGVEKNLPQALNNYRAAAEGGDDEALLALGDCFDRGIGVKINRTTAFYYYSRAVAAGSIKGMRKMAVALLDGRGVLRDVPRGMKLLQSAAAAGDEAARYMLEQRIKR